MTTLNSATFYDLMQQGGLVMWILLVFSIAILATALERYLVVRRASTPTAPLITGLEDALRRQRSPTKAIRVCEEASGAVARVAQAGLERFDRTAARMEKAIERRAAAELQRLTRRMSVLSTIALAAPLLGFLGTVVGMMVSFASLAKFGTANSALVAEGITQALTTTAGGLTVALPAQLLHSYLAARVDRIAADMEAVGYLLLEAQADVNA